VKETTHERDDVRLAVLDHLAKQGDEGQGALAWAAIHHDDPAIRHEAITRIETPARDDVLMVLDGALRSPVHSVANAAGALAGTLNALEAIPLLMMAQVTTDRVENEGDLAWIAVQTQTAYVQRLEPVAGSGAGAFQPVVGVVNEGAVLRVVDAVAIFYRTEVHRVVVSMTTTEWGQSTEYLGYDLPAWWRWYNEEFVPYKNDQAERAALAEEPTDPTERGGGQPARTP
jgi:hypothetical protein